MPDPALRLLQHIERHTVTIPIECSLLARTMAFFFGHHTLQTARLGEGLQRATRLDLDASHCLEAAPSEEEDPGPHPVSR